MFPGRVGRVPPRRVESSVHAVVVPALLNQIDLCAQVADQHVSTAEKQERTVPAKASLEMAKLDEAKAYPVLTCCSSPINRLDSVRAPPRIRRRNLRSQRLPGFLFCRLIQASLLARRLYS